MKTSTKIRQEYKAQGCFVRISRDGIIEYKPDPDYHPGTQKSAWLFGGYVDDHIKTGDDK